MRPRGCLASQIQSIATHAVAQCTKRNYIKRGLRAANGTVSYGDLTFKLLMSRDLIADGWFAIGRCCCLASVRGGVLDRHWGHLLRVRVAKIMLEQPVSVPALLHNLPSYTRLLDELHALRPIALHLDADALYSLTLGHRLDVCTRPNDE